MDIGIVSVRYAKALMEYAADCGAEDDFYKWLYRLEEAFRTQSDLRRTLDNPILTQKEKLGIIALAAVGETPAPKEFTRFVMLVLQNHRENVLQYICLSFIDLYRKRKHIGVARITTAVPVTPAVRERIRSSASAVLHAVDVELQTEVKPSIEGGFIFDVNGYRLDASIATQLKKVKQQFIDKNRRIV